MRTNNFFFFVTACCILVAGTVTYSTFHEAQIIQQGNMHINHQPTMQNADIPNIYPVNSLGSRATPKLTAKQMQEIGTFKKEHLMAGEKLWFAVKNSDMTLPNHLIVFTTDLADPTYTHNVHVTQRRLVEIMNAPYRGSFYNIESGEILTNPMGGGTGHSP